ncbi:MAG: NAD(P)-dependent oxidoreductase [archaeon]|nr:NAD(P)-dependent oxidoreductase [archaeon]
MNIAMTGHDGLIGSVLKKRLEAQGHKFVLLVDERSGNSLQDLEDLRVSEKIDMFIHAAAHCKINQSITNPKLPHINNSEGTFHVLEFCRTHNIKKFLFFSSSRILSKEKNPYTASKIYGEELCKAYQQCYGIDYLIVRPSTVYGPFWDLTKRLVHIFITHALENKDLVIYGDPKTKTLDFTHVEDFVSAVLLALGGEWNKEYDISGDSEYNVFDLAQFIIKHTDSASQIQVAEPERAQPQKVHLDISAIRSLGYKPEYTVESGILETINWYKTYLKR